MPTRSRLRTLALPALATALVALTASASSGQDRAGRYLADQDVADGRAIAERWCAACHLVSPDQETAMDGVASFREVAERGPLVDGALEAFLADPHPSMPDMALTREEITDLTAYIDSLRE